MLFLHSPSFCYIGSEDAYVIQVQYQGFKLLVP